MIEEPKSCQDIAAGCRLQDVSNYSDACAHCHKLWDADIICNCDTDASLVGCDTCPEIYNDENIEFLNPDPAVTAPTPEPSDPASLSPTDTPSEEASMVTRKKLVWQNAPTDAAKKVLH